MIHDHNAQADDRTDRPSPPPGHEPVLVEQVMALLNPQPGLVCLDCTVGRGGHASVIAPRLAPSGRYIGLDVDPTNVAFANSRIREQLDGIDVAHDVMRANFRDARRVLDDLGIDAVDLVLADLGFASNQVDNPERGFSFKRDGPLDMRLDPGLDQTAADLVNHLPEHELANLIYLNSGERRSRRIARKIVEQRSRSPIKTTEALAQTVRQAYGPRRKRSGPKRSKRPGASIDPATRTFMALRIAVNTELESLEQMLNGLSELMRPDAIAVVISFHSLEDRLVKHAFNALHRQRLAVRLTPKPLVAVGAQRYANPRSRSAKLRAIKRLGCRPDEQAGTIM